MNLKYVENISTDKTNATMRLYGRIGDVVNGAGFAAEMRYLSEMCNEINMRINSEGGSVLEGYTILDAMNEVNASGKCKVNTHNSGMAASMASVILCNGVNRTADNYAITMIHNAGGDTSDKVLNAINASIQTIYKDRTRLNGDTAANLMSAETFMNTDMAMEYGFIDSVIQTGKKVKLPKNKSVEALAKIYNELITPKTMNKVTALLGLKNEASEDVIAESVEALQEKIKNLEADKVTNDAELKKATDKLKAIEDAEKAKTETEVITKVDNAISKGLDKTKRDDLIALGKTNMSMLDMVIESSAKASKTVAVLPAGAGKVVAGGEDRSSWTIMDWQKKDAKGLEEIQNTTPEVYTQMYENYYKLGIGNPKFKNK